MMTANDYPQRKDGSCTIIIVKWIAYSSRRFI